MDVAHAEMVEKELGTFIERRFRKEPDPDELEPTCAESVRRYHERHRREIRAGEVLPAVAARFHPLDCECEECL